MKYRKIDNVTLEALQEINSSASRLSRIFNFEAQQLVVLYQNREYNSGVAITAAMTTHNFADLPNPEEIKKMHEKLTELGGNPPALDTITLFAQKPGFPNFDQARKGPANG